MAAILNSILFFLNTFQILDLKSKKSIFTETGVTRQMSITPYKTPIGHETGQKRVGPCINMCPGCQGRHQMINIEKLSYRLSRKYLGQRYTKPQTFWHVDTWSNEFLAILMPDWEFYKGF